MLLWRTAYQRYAAKRRSGAELNTPAHDATTPQPPPRRCLSHVALADSGLQTPSSSEATSEDGSINDGGGASILVANPVFDAAFDPGSGLLDAFSTTISRDASALLGVTVGDGVGLVELGGWGGAGQAVPAPPLLAQDPARLVHAHGLDDGQVFQSSQRQDTHHWPHARPAKRWCDHHYHHHQQQLLHHHGHQGGLHAPLPHNGTPAPPPQQVGRRTDEPRGWAQGDAHPHPVFHARAPSLVDPGGLAQRGLLQLDRHSAALSGAPPTGIGAGGGGGGGDSVAQGRYLELSTIGPPPAVARTPGLTPCALQASSAPQHSFSTEAAGAGHGRGMSLPGSTARPVVARTADGGWEPWVLELGTKERNRFIKQRGLSPADAKALKVATRQSKLNAAQRRCV